LRVSALRVASAVSLGLAFALATSAAGTAVAEDTIASLPGDCTPRGVAIVRDRLCVAGGAGGAFILSLPDLKPLKHIQPLPIFGEAIAISGGGGDGLVAIHCKRGWMQFVSARPGGESPSDGYDILSCLPIDGLAFSAMQGRSIVTLRYFYEGLKVKKKVRELGCGKLGKRRARIRGRLRFTDDFDGLAATADTALVITVHKDKRTVSIVRAADVSNPTLLDHLTDLGNVRSVAAGHGRGYVCSADKGLWIIPFGKYRSSAKSRGQEPDDIVVGRDAGDEGPGLRRVEIPGKATSVAATKGAAVVATEDALHVLAIDEVEAQLTHTFEDVTADAVAASDRFAAACDGKATLWVFDISDPERPHQVCVARAR